MSRYLQACLLCGFLLPAVGCDPGEASTGNDAATQPGAHQLTIQTPPGRSIGLRPGEQILLRVLYVTQGGLPEANAKVTFGLIGNAGGATLAGFHAWTDRDGVAEMQLTVGAEDATFEVEVSAQNALAVRFEVAVGVAGFTGIEIFPEYQGERAVTAFGTLTSELHFNGRCGDLNPAGDNDPDRVRSMENGFGGLLLFDNLPVNFNYALAVRAADPDGAVLAWGCVEVASVQLLPGVTLRAHLPVYDVGPSPVGTFQMVSSIQLGLDDPDSLALALAPLSALGRCPYDPYQRLLDCLSDVLAPDGAPDCVPQGANPVTEDLGELRGALDQNGCRQALTNTGEPSLEALLWEATDATGILQFSALADLAAHDGALLQRFDVHSRIAVSQGPQAESYFARHTLSQVEFPDYAPGAYVTLSLLGGPILESILLPATYSMGDTAGTATLALPPHALTLRPRRAALAAAIAHHLTPVGLPADFPALVQQLLFTLGQQVSTTRVTGCQAVDVLLCDVMNLEAGCPAGRCADAVSMLLAHAQQHWAASVSETGPDTMLSGVGDLWDADGDLVADYFGTATGPRKWLMTLALDGAWISPVSSTFAATRLANEGPL